MPPTPDPANASRSLDPAFTLLLSTASREFGLSARMTDSSSHRTCCSEKAVPRI